MLDRFGTHRILIKRRRQQLVAVLQHLLSVRMSLNPQTMHLEPRQYQSDKNFQ